MYPRLIDVDGWMGQNADIKDGAVPIYDFFAPGPLPGYAGNMNNNNGWLEANDYLLGELEAMVDEPWPVAEAKEEQVVTIVVDMEEEHMAALVIDMEEDLAVLFGKDDDFEDDDFSDDNSEGVEEEKVWEVNEEWLMALVTQPSVVAVHPSSVYEVRGPSTIAAEGPSFYLPAPGLPIPLSVIEDLSTHLGNMKYGHGQLVKKVIQVQVMTSQMVHAKDRLEHVGAKVEQGQQTATQGDKKIAELTQQVQLLQYILALDRRLAELGRRPPQP
nr:hypothetical protein [Tanacetum cinerariifolium]